MELPLFPLNTVLFPGATLPLHIFEERYKLMISHCLREGSPFGVCLIKSGDEVGSPAEPFDVGTTAEITSAQELQEGRMNITCLGRKRFVIRKLTQTAPFMVGQVELLESEPGDDEATGELMQSVAALFAEYVGLNLAVTNQWSRSLDLPSDAATLSDFVAGRIAVDTWTRQRMLEELSPRVRLEVEVEALSMLIEQLTEQVAVVRQVRWAGFGVLN